MPLPNSVALVRRSLLLSGIALTHVLGLAACGAGGGSEDLGTSGAEVASCAKGTVTHGVDVSHYDGTVNWTSARAAGIDFAFAKATQGTTLHDAQFATNWSAMKAAGVLRGAYHFFDASADPTVQASFVLSTVGPLDAGDLPIVLDFESFNGVSETTAVAHAATFLAAVTQATGKTAILYMSSQFLASPHASLAPYPLWVANYGVTCPGLPSAFSSWTFWQSSESGKVSGIGTAVDLDVYNGTLAQLVASLGGSGGAGGGGSSSGGSGSSSGGGGSGGGSSSSGSSSGASSSSGSGGGTCGPVPAGSVDRASVIANAEQWVAAKLQYCQSENGQPDADPSCAATCSRTSDAAWDPYRSDCSGLVSWAWELPPPGLVTDEFAPFASSPSKAIPCADLLPGDAANRNSVGHIVLFKEWVTPGTKAVFIEEPGCSSSMPYAHEFTSAVTCSGNDVTIAYEGATFTAIRYDHVVDAPACGGGGSGSSSGGSSSGGSSGGSSSGSSSGGSSSGGSSSGGGSGGSSSGSSSGGGTACTSDGDCNPGADGSGLICVGGTCTPGCNANWECPGSTTCVSGTCQ